MLAWYVTRCIVRQGSIIPVDADQNDINLGVGSNADVLFLQTRALREKLASSFRFVFANGPFFCEPGPGMLPVYEGAGPFRRWFRWFNSHRTLKPKYHIEAIRRCLEDAIADDNESGACGPWVGILGFSQGARLAASMLFESQRRQTLRENGETPEGYEGPLDFTIWDRDWNFAIFISGPAPLIALSPNVGDLPLQGPTELILCQEELEKQDIKGKCSIKRPTLHVIGVHDEWAPSQKILYDAYCSEESKNIFEWEGDHRVPFHSPEVDQICELVLSMTSKE